MANASSSNDNTLATLAHLSGLLVFIVPLANIVAPLVIWLVKKDSSEFVSDQAKEALNFQISMTLYSIIAAILILIFIGFVLILALLIADIFLIIKASMAANNGQKYRYPFILRLIK